MDYRQVIIAQIKHLEEISAKGDMDSDSACRLAETILTLCKEITIVPNIKE